MSEDWRGLLIIVSVIAGYYALWAWMEKSSLVREVNRYLTERMRARSRRRQLRREQRREQSLQKDLADPSRVERRNKRRAFWECAKAYSLFGFGLIGMPILGIIGGLIAKSLDNEAWPIVIIAAVGGSLQCWAIVILAFICDGRESTE